MKPVHLITVLLKTKKELKRIGINNWIKSQTDVSPVDVENELSGPEYFEDGLHLLDKAEGNRDGYKQAYFAFRNALNYKPADKAIIEKLEEARDAATIYVMMIPMENYGGY
ncbi:MAG: hypothetical protein EOP55_19920, partial [Sphingobacteriales bacterium]